MRKKHVSHWIGEVPDDQVEKIPNSRHDGIYRRWLGMMDRCHNPKSKNNTIYKKRCISVVKEWHGLNGYFRFREWALSNGYADDLVIDRIDGHGDYSPQNCRWVTKQQNNKNRISPKHVTKTKPECKNSLYFSRIAAGKSVKDVMNYMSVSAATVYYWEQGMYTPTVDHLMKLADFYGCDVSTLLIGNKEDPGNE